MLKRTHRRFPGPNRNPHLLLISLLLPGTLFFGCGNDAPQQEPGRPGGADTAESAPGDTIVLAPPPVETGSEARPGATTARAGTAPTTEAVTVSNTLTPGTATPNRTERMEAVGTGEVREYDPAAFDRLLRTNVANGKVDYEVFKSSGEFAEVLRSISTASLDGMSANAKLAFWINTYNALVIRNVNDNPGIKRPLDVAGFFDRKKFSAAGRQVTLDQIENEIIRPTFGEPLIHFGLVCAARSCPPLIAKAYTEGNVRSQLAANAEAYLADTKQNRYDAGTRTLYLSKIFEWYKDDFGGNDAGLIAFAGKYGPGSMKTALASATGVTVRFNEYDWTLNKK